MTENIMIKILIVYIDTQKYTKTSKRVCWIEATEAF